MSKHDLHPKDEPLELKKVKLEDEKLPLQDLNLKSDDEKLPLQDINLKVEDEKLPLQDLVIDHEIHQERLATGQTEDAPGAQEDQETSAGATHDQPMGEQSDAEHDSSDDNDDMNDNSDKHQCAGDDCDGWNCDEEHEFGERISWIRTKKMEDVIAAKSCNRCGTITPQKCKGCKAVVYCDKICQGNDWDIHKTVCKTFGNLPDRPSAHHRLVIHIHIEVEEIAGMSLQGHVMHFNARKRARFQPEYTVFRDGNAFRRRDIKANFTIMDMMQDYRAVDVLGPCVLTAGINLPGGHWMQADVTPGTLRNFMDNMIWGSPGGEMPSVHPDSRPPFPEAGKLYDAMMARAEAYDAANRRAEAQAAVSDEEDDDEEGDEDEDEDE